MGQIGVYAVAVIIVLVVGCGLWRRVDVFGSFTQGVKEGFGTIKAMAPPLIGLIVGVSMLEASGFFEALTGWITPLCRLIGVPPEVVPLGMLRPVTGSGSFAVLNTVLEVHGPDSVIGKIASVMAGSTETTFYAIAVYYGAVGLKKTRHTIPAALTADMTAMIAAAWLVRCFG